jgi:N-hydroxyarylamine O-acetyltransferase
VNEPKNPAYGWQGDLLDLDAYLARVGLAGELPPTLPTLRALVRAHVLSIPFENLEIVLGRPVLLGVEDLQTKLVRSPRGGYCYEHVSLFAAVLERLGFEAAGLAARVQVGRGTLRPASHALLRVRVPGVEREWICDVGFGEGQLEPVELADGAETTGEKWAFRLERLESDGGERWLLRALRPDGPADMHVFGLDRRYAVDYLVLNHYISTHPRSPFTGRLVVQGVRPGARHVLHDTTLTTSRTDGAVETVRLEPGEVPKTLEEVYGIVLTTEDTARLVARLESGIA